MIVPSFSLVGFDDVIAGVAAIGLLIVSAVAWSTIIFGQALGQDLPLLLVFFGLDVGLDGDFVFGDGESRAEMEAMFEEGVGEVKLGVSGDIDDVEVEVVAVKGGKSDVEVDTHFFAEADNDDGCRCVIIIRGKEKSESQGLR